MKTCYRCKETKALNLFYRNKAKTDGLASACKLCAKQIKDKWLAENPSRASGHKASHYQANRDQIKARSTAWKAKNPTRRVAILRKYALKESAEMTPAYVATVMRMRVAALTPELLELKREQLITHRLARQVKQHLKETKNGQKDRI